MKNIKILQQRDFPGGPVVKNPPCNAGDMSLIPGEGTKILHAAEKLSSLAATTEPCTATRESLFMRHHKDPAWQTKTWCNQINEI